MIVTREALESEVVEIIQSAISSGIPFCRKLMVRAKKGS